MTRLTAYGTHERDLPGIPGTGNKLEMTAIGIHRITDGMIVEHWSNKWADLLQVNRKFLGAVGAAKFREWIKGEVAKNTPYDEFARKILTATGSNKANPPASA